MARTGWATALLLRCSSTSYVHFALAVHGIPGPFIGGLVDITVEVVVARLRSSLLGVVRTAQAQVDDGMLCIPNRRGAKSAMTCLQVISWTLQDSSPKDTLLLLPPPQAHPHLSSSTVSDSFNLTRDTYHRSRMFFDRLAAIAALKCFALSHKIAGSKDRE